MRRPGPKRAPTPTERQVAGYVAGMLMGFVAAELGFTWLQVLLATLLTSIVLVYYGKKRGWDAVTSADPRLPPHA